MVNLSNFTPPPHPEGITLDGQLVRLEPLDSEKHAQQLFESNSEKGGERNWTYLPYGPFNTVSDYSDWLRSIEGLPDPVFFTIIRKEDERAVGVASYLRINPNEGSIEVGHINFSPCLQRTAEATETMFLMMQWAFNSGYRRYEWKCNAKNVKSRKAAQRLGLSYEGVFRQASISKGQNRDTAWFAAIDKEWQQLEAAFSDYFKSCNSNPKSLRVLTEPILVKKDNLEFSS
ncbi:GNAT family N-acetyltransferase [Alphaproteobacteria bacterium]|nr:GNAT family N-acetyltransferase [Alphaproteobacteria bacterium]